MNPATLANWHMSTTIAAVAELLRPNFAGHLFHVSQIGTNPDIPSSAGKHADCNDCKLADIQCCTVLVRHMTAMAQNPILSSISHKAFQAKSFEAVICQFA